MGTESGVLSVEPPAWGAGRPGARALSPTVVLTGAILGYRILVDYAYVTVIATLFSYQGFQRTMTAGSFIVSWAFLLALLPLLIRVLQTETLSAQITGMLGLLSLVPTTTLIAWDPRYPATYIVLMFVYWLLFLLACVFMPAIQPFRRPFQSEVPHLVTLTILAGAILYISWRYTGFRIHLGLWDVYTLRAEARLYEVSTILGYLATFSDNILPVLLAYYLRRRWWVVAAGLGFVILLNFGISATKQVLFLLVFAFGSVLVGESLRLNRKVLFALAAITFISAFEKQVVGTAFVAMLSLHRLQILPAQLHWIHYDFFQTRELLNLTQSALRFFFESPYRENVQFLIGEYHVGEIAARANNGLFSDGYMNFGAPSVLFYPVLAVFVLKLVEGAAKGLSSSVRFLLVLSLAFVFLGVPLPTALLTAGTGILVLLLPTLPRADGAAK